MYNLKQVSTIIGFESKLIKILIVDNTTSNIHCLYSNSMIKTTFSILMKLKKSLGLN